MPRYRPKRVQFNWSNPMSEEETKMRQSMLQRYKQLGSPKLSQWGEMARDHWRENLPSLVSELQKQGLLSIALILAQEDAGDRYAQLMNDGVDPLGAREIALKEFILIDPPEPST